MALRRYSRLVRAGVLDQPLALPIGDDADVLLRFVDEADDPVDLTDAAILKLTGRDAGGVLLFAHGYTEIVGSPTNGTVRWQVLSADTVNEQPQVGRIDVQERDTLGRWSQLLEASDLTLAESVGLPLDPVTNPPAGYTGVYAFTARAGTPAVVPIFTAAALKTYDLRITIVARRRNDGAGYGDALESTITNESGVGTTRFVGARPFDRPSAPRADIVVNDAPLWGIDLAIATDTMSLTFTVDNLSAFVDGTIRVEDLTAPTS